MTRQMSINLPDEILSNIFGKLAYGDLRECLKVCHSWHKRVKAHLGTNVRLRSDEDIESFLNYIEKKPAFAAVVNRLDLHISDEQQKISRSMIDKLFGRRLDIIELRVNTVMLFDNRELPLNLAYSKLEHICCWDKPECCISYQMFEVRASLKVSRSEDNVYGDHGTNVDGRRDIYRFPNDRFRRFDTPNPLHFPSVNYESWLDLFRQQFTLKTLKIQLNEDGENVRYLWPVVNETETQTIEKLSRLESLQVQNKPFCTIPFHFISQYMTGLQELKFTQDIVFDKSWTDTQLQGLYDSFADLLSRLRSCDIFLRVRKGTVFPSTVIESFYQQSPSCYHHSKKVFNFAVGNINATITLNSEKYGDERVKRLVIIEFDRENSVDSLVNSVISTLKIDTFRFSRHNRYNFPDDYVQVFQSTLDNLPYATEVFCNASSNRFSCQAIRWRQYLQVKHLELYSLDNAVDFPPMGSQFTRVFKNIASLKLNYNRLPGYVNLKDLKLERLYLDLSRMWYDVQHSGTRTPSFLDVTKISNEDIDELREKEDSHLEIRIQADEVQNITLNFYSEISIRLTP